ncbi:hypothetical protein QE152_g5210 [Popillia japonica]|uniref:DUF7869 domain-containing protein n=1 Tax=Popillia japonica TaxID=7064 RepID=A0AAW1MIU7_POPJA
MQWICKLPQDIKEISIFSDTCAGPNRSQYIFALLLFLVQSTHIDIIEQKFLESGHSYMEVDSMHSAIEREKKYVSVNSVSDWANIMQRARSKRNRKSANPYHVSQLHFSDMLDLKDLSKRIIQHRLKDVDGNKNWLEIKCLRYDKADPSTISFRYDHSGPYKTFNVRGRGRQPLIKEVKKVYSNYLPIS